MYLVCRLLLEKKIAEAKAVADKMLALPGISAGQKLELYLALCQLSRENGRLDEAKAAADKALALPGISGEQKQGVYLSLCQAFCIHGASTAKIYTLSLHDALPISTACASSGDPV